MHIMKFLLCLCLISITLGAATRCGDGVCSSGEDCFADCAGDNRRFVCPFSKALPLPSFVGVNNTKLGNSIMDGSTWATPGSEHLGKGFDVVSGLETTHPVIALQFCDDDPDAAAFFSNFQQGSIFLVPQGMHITPRPECSYSSSTTMYATAYNYAQSKAHASQMSVSASVSVSVGSLASASASASYSKDNSVQTAVSLTENKQRQIAVTEGHCLVSSFGWIDPLDTDFGKNHLHPDFETQLNALQTVADAKRLVAKYGTHFYGRGTLGGKMEQIVAIESSVISQSSSQAVSESVSKSFSASVSGGIGSFSASASASGSTSSQDAAQTALSNSISSSSTKSEIRTYGGAPFSPTSGDWTSWATSISGAPVVVDYSLVEILSILPAVVNRNNISIRQLWSDGVYQYLLENQYSYGNTYELTTHTLCNVTNDDNAYGPYAFQIVAADGSPTIMDNFDLFRGLSNGEAFYFATNMVSLFPVSIYNNIVSPISRIDLVSMSKFFELASNSSTFANIINSQQSMQMAQSIVTQNRYELYSFLCVLFHEHCTGAQPTQAPFQKSINSMQQFPLYYASLLDKSQGMEMLFYPSFMDATNHTMSMYAQDRRFYEVTINIVTSQEASRYTNICAPSSFTSGIIEIILFGSLDKLVHQRVLSSCYQLSVDSYYNTFQIPSQKVLGDLTAISVKAMHTSAPFCTLVTSVKVVNLDGVVYWYSYSTPTKFSLNAISPTGINAASARNANTQNLVQGQSKATASLLAPLERVATNSGPWLYYLYKITSPALQNGSISVAQLCNNAGGVLASSYHLTKAVTNRVNWCTPGSSFDSTNTTCFMLRSSSNSSCAGGAVGIVPVTTTGCPAICYGPQPSTLLLQTINATLVESPVALDVSYVSIASINATIKLPGDTNYVPINTSHPTCNVSVTYVQQGSAWVSNGETIRQFNLAFQNTGSVIITSITINMDSAALRNQWNVNLISSNTFSVSLSNGIFVGQTINTAHGVQSAGNNFYVNLASVACN